MATRTNAYTAKPTTSKRTRPYSKAPPSARQSTVSRIYPCASCATFSPPSTPSCPVCLSLSLSLCLCLGACLACPGRLQAQAQSCSFTHSDTTASPHNLRQTERHTLLPPVSSVFLAPLGILSRSHYSRRRWIVLSVSLTTASSTCPLHPPHHPNNRLAAYRRPSLPEESGLLACRLSPRPTSLRTRAMRPTRWSLRRNSSYQDRGFPALSRYSRVTTS
jgi:hypothetical protein